MYTEAPYIEEIANRIIDTMDDLNHIRYLDIKVGYLYSDVEKKAAKNLVYADCTIVRGLLSHYCPYDFIITIYELNTFDLTDAQLQVLIYHELLHIGTDGKLRNHDVMDFRTILEDYGFDWHKDPFLDPIIKPDKNKIDKGNLIVLPLPPLPMKGGDINE